MRIAVLIERLTEMIRKIVVKTAKYLKTDTIHLERCLIESTFRKICICRRCKFKIYM